MTGTENRDAEHAMTALNAQGLDPWGNPQSWTIAAQEGGGATGSSLVGNDVLLVDGRLLTTLRCPPAANRRRREDLERMLDRQIRAGVRLARRYTPNGEDSGYPPGFGRLVGYAFDTAEPIALITRRVGAPARRGANRLINMQAKRSFAADLMAAVAALSAVDLVHGGLTLDTVFVDPDAPSSVWIGAFDHTVERDERRPDQQRAHPGDDVRDAGRLLAVAFAQASPDPGTIPDLASVDWLEQALDGVFEPDPRSRPTALDVLGRLGETHRAIPPRDRGDALAAGRSRYEELRAPKSPPAGEATTEELATPAPRARRSLNPVTVTVVVLVVAALAIVLVALVLAAR